MMVPTITFTKSIMKQFIGYGEFEENVLAGGGSQLVLNRLANPNKLNFAMWMEFVPKAFKNMAEEAIIYGYNEFTKNLPHGVPLANDKTITQIISHIQDQLFKRLLAMPDVEGAFDSES